MKPKQNKFKISTKISLYFSIFLVVIFSIVITFINIFSFYSWHTEETTEVKIDLDKMNKNTLSKHSNESIKRKNTIENLEKNLGVYLKEDIDEDYTLIGLNIYKKWDKYYLIYFHDSKFGPFAIPYDITLIIYNQIVLLKLSIILIILLFFISYIIAKFLFTKLILKDIHNISKQLKNIDLLKISKINTNIREDDDIYIIVESINNFIGLINTYTTNLKQFNSNVSHEFRTPLMVMQGEIEFALETGEYKGSYNKIESQIDLLNKLLETFIFISKIDEKSINLSKKDINISITTKDILTNLKNIYKDKNISIIENIKDNIIIKTDEKLIYIVIKNIIDNSFKYTDIGGNINIEITNKYIKIKDNGVGINKDSIKNIFNNFYRESDDKKGFGIGLNIVQKIINILGLKIQVQSQKGKGSEFTIIF